LSEGSVLPLVRRKRRKESGWEREVVKRHRCAELRRRPPDRTRRKYMMMKEAVAGKGEGLRRREKAGEIGREGDSARGQ
jgi:hypothetical protein